jgi:hypothetical protein
MEASSAEKSRNNGHCQGYLGGGEGMAVSIVRAPDLYYNSHAIYNNADFPCFSDGCPSGRKGKKVNFVEAGSRANLQKARFQALSAA